MNTKYLYFLKYFTKCLCIFAALLFVALWLYRYTLDTDSSVVESRYYFDDPDDVFPVMSLCFEQSFNDELLQRFGKNITGSKYKQFLAGNYFDNVMTTIDYGSVTTNISDFVLSYDVKFRNQSGVTDTLTNIAWKELYHTLTWQSWGILVKCFGLEITDKEVNYVRVYMKRQIFPGGFRESDGGFAVLFHYPNQVFASMQTVKRQWTKRDNVTNFSMSFNLKGLDVNIQRYKKNRNNCVLNWKNYDNITLQNHLNKVGCKTPAQITNDTWPICTNQGRMRKAILHPVNTHNVNPCNEVESIDYDMGETDEPSRTFKGGDWKNWVCFVYRILNPRFRVIIQKKAVDFQTLIGYIGGYIGIFTGFAISQIPDFVLMTVEFAKSWFVSPHN